jgi:hypothetical protein
MNMLFDPTTNTITALVDFEFSHIAGPADELFYSFSEFCGLMKPVWVNTEDNIKLRQFQIGEAELPLPDAPAPPTGPSTSSQESLSTGEPPQGESNKEEKSTEEPKPPKVDWSLAAKWDAALLAAKAIRPRDLDGIAGLSVLYWFLQEICSPFMLMPRVLAQLSEEQKTKKIEESEKNLVLCLEHLGY